jgi:DNA-binding response OmpR family regulator
MLDVMMPDLGGVRVLQEMRADPELRGMDVLVVTGKAEAVSGLRDELGEENVFLKPFGVEALLSRVAELTGGP